MATETNNNSGFFINFVGVLAAAAVAVEGLRRVGADNRTVAGTMQGYMAEGQAGILRRAGQLASGLEQDDVAADLRVAAGRALLAQHGRDVYRGAEVVSNTASQAVEQFRRRMTS